MKGFAHTVEAIIASLMLLSTATVIIPKLTAPDEPERRLEALGESDLTERMENISPSAANSEAEDIVPTGYSVSSFVRETSTLSYQAGSDPERYLNRSGGSIVIHVFADGGPFNATYRGNRFATDAGSGYHETRSPDTEGFLNFTGTVDATVEVVNQSVRGQISTGSDRYFYSHVTYNETPGEVRVAVWN
ncbi:MAG: hypothetical protein ABEJ03_01735 [Candidatus Nanohaloarchaea archaeon]